MSVWKATVPVKDDPVQIEMPVDSKVLFVGAQSPDPRWVAMWYSCSTDAPPVKRYFRVIGTGHESPRGGVYLGTVIYQDHGLVWHVYEVPA